MCPSCTAYWITIANKYVRRQLKRTKSLAFPTKTTDNITTTRRTNFNNDSCFGLTRKLFRVAL